MRQSKRSLWIKKIPALAGGRACPQIAPRIQYRHRVAARVCSGGLRYSPMISRTFSTKNGSVESLKFFYRWGFSPNARQIRTMAFCLRTLAGGAGSGLLSMDSAVGRIVLGNRSLL
jgi:hypothetical protein